MGGRQTRMRVKFPGGVLAKEGVNESEGEKGDLKELESGTLVHSANSWPREIVEKSVRGGHEG